MNDIIKGWKVKSVTGPQTRQAHVLGTVDAIAQ